MSIRQDYKKFTLDEKDVNPNPILQFAEWFKLAEESNLTEYYIMTLATADKEGRPSARIVLLRNFDENGFVFYTNYTSRKGNDILENPNAALLFFWQDLERQVRVEGTLTKQTEAESDAYFASRPFESKLGAWTSEQSKVIESRNVLDERFAEVLKKYADGNVPRPPHWGGYVLKPTHIEFWQGRPSRLHDRILFTLENNVWKMERLAP
jgi:pyridoxamine 5'-phosphate oxidase